MSQPDYRLHVLTEDHLGEITEYWPQAHRLHPMTPRMLRQRLFEPAADPSLCLAARDGEGRMAGLAIGVWPVGEVPEGGATVGGIRWLGVRPELIGSGVEHLLADELCRRLAALGARTVRLHATPPYYIRPGIDIRDTALIASLIAHGWSHAATHINMTVDLLAWNAPDSSAIFGLDRRGCLVRRARPDDRAALEIWMRRHWTTGWTCETMLAIDQDPPTLFLAHQGETLVGFAAYEANQCLGSFGPTGVLDDFRGVGLGRRLLEACLAELKVQGQRQCEIGWVGPVPFYHRACGAQIGPVYWELQWHLDKAPHGKDSL